MDHVQLPLLRLLSSPLSHSSVDTTPLFLYRQARARKVRCQAASRTANLTACRCLNVPLPVHTDRDGRPRTLSEFLKLPVGREAMLKGQSCKRKELIGEDTFRWACMPLDPSVRSMDGFYELVAVGEASK